MNLAGAARPTRLRLIIVTAVLAVAGLLAATTQAASARTGAQHVSRWDGGTKPVIVLEHGAWADASSWSKVIRQLQEDGFTVDAPPNPLRGVTYDSAYLADFLSTISGPIVLVGHSYGGFVTTNAATGNPNVKALVYVDAFIPDQGETLLDLVSAPARILPRREPRQRLQLRPLPRRARRRRRHLHQAEPGPGLLRQRAAAQPGRGHRRHPAAAGGQHPARALRPPGLEDHPVLGRDRHRRPGHPARRADLHGQARRRPHHRRQRRAPVHDRRPGDGRGGHQASGRSDQVNREQEGEKRS